MRIGQDVPKDYLLLSAPAQFVIVGKLYR